MKIKKVTSAHIRHIICTRGKHLFYLCGWRKLCPTFGYQNRVAMHSYAKGDMIEIGPRKANESCCCMCVVGTQAKWSFIKTTNFGKSKFTEPSLHWINGSKPGLPRVTCLVQRSPLTNQTSVIIVNGGKWWGRKQKKQTNRLRFMWHIKNIWIKQLSNCKVRDFTMALRAQKFPGLSRNGQPGRMSGGLQIFQSMFRFRPLFTFSVEIWRECYPINQAKNGGGEFF